MAHEISSASGKHEFAYCGEAPWHNLGKRLDNVATSAEMLAAAGLGWRVLSQPVFTLPVGGDFKIVEGFAANVRSDSGDVLGIVSTDYKAVQNDDAFGFMDALVGEAAAMFHTAGAVRKGRLVFALAKLPESLVVVPDDVIERYLLLVNAHDGTGALHLRFTDVRVVCMNTLSAALGGRVVGGKAFDIPTVSNSITIRHTGNVSARLDEARKALGIAQRYFKVSGQAYAALTAKQLSAMELKGFIEAFLPIPITKTAEAAMGAAVATGEAEDLNTSLRERIRKAHEIIAFLFQEGRGNTLPGARGTAWAALNAATEWVDHVRTAKKDGTMRASAPEAAVFGVGQDLRQRAMDAALALL